MPIKRIGVKKYIWVAANNDRGQNGSKKIGTTNFSHRKTGHRTKGSYQNPIQCWRKASTDKSCNGVQEVFIDTPCVDKNGTCLRSQKIRIRSGMLQTNAQLKDPTKRYNYNYKQYLQRKCKTIQQNSFNFSTDSSQPHQFRGNCSQNTDGDCCFNGVTYKPNNKKFSTQGAVSAGARLVRLKYDAITKNGRDCTTSCNPYRMGTQNKIIKSKSCQEKMVSSGKRIFRSGGPRRRPRLAHSMSSDPASTITNKKPLTCGTKDDGCC